VVGERRFTAGLARFFGTDATVLVGIGDDAAVVRAPRRPIVLTCDPVVVGVHCTAATPARAVGAKAVLRNLSDLAAMGALPDWLLVAVLLPQGTPAAWRRGLFAGIRAASRRHGCRVVGGDVGVTPGPANVVVTAVGHLPGRALRRDAAVVGDAIHVTGALGGSILGRHLRFQPRLAEGQHLAAQRATGAVMDISDGLLLDLATMLAASSTRAGVRLGAELDAAAIPIHPAARGLATTSRRTALQHAMADGEDYELLFTWRGRRPPTGLGAVARRPIGRVVATPGLWLRDAEGHRRRLRPEGYEHDL
jgi:thiamine-monophosphate kinase